MGSSSLPSPVKRFWLQVGLIDAAGIVVTGAVCWFMGYRTLGPYRDGLFLVGAVIGLLGVASLWLTTDLFESRAQVSMAVFGRQPLPSAQKDRRQSFVLVCVTAGGVLIALSLILRLILAGAA